MLGLLLKNFIRSKGLMIGLFLLFLSGCISINIGKYFLDSNKEVIAQTAHYQKGSIDRNVEYHPNDMGLLLYYLRFGLIHDLPNLAGLSIGQRDIHPSLVSVTIRNLEEQKYAADLKNPMYQLLGNMDFSFVLLYFFPLIIIAFCFNLISEEKEDGIWNLILSQTANPKVMLAQKIGIRYASILLVLLLLLVIGQVILDIPFDSAFLIYSLVAILYVTFWFCLSWLVASLHKNSSQNALILLLSWILLTIVIPALVNVAATHLYPVPEAYGTVLESRDGYHTQWDKPKSPTIKKFHQQYPQFSAYDHPENASFSWLWYFAMQQMGDDQAAQDAQDLKEKLRHRNSFSSASGWLFPTIHTQLSVSALARSDLNHHIGYWEALEAFHEEKRLYFYPRIFQNTAVADEDWDSFVLEHHQGEIQLSGLSAIWPLILMSLLAIGLARFVGPGIPSIQKSNSE